jgi:hypothetical protein
LFDGGDFKLHEDPKRYSTKSFIIDSFRKTGMFDEMLGSLKNFLDYFWSEFAGKTFGYIVASHEKGLTVMDQMRTAVKQCYGWSMPYGISINPEDDFNDKRELISTKLSSRLDMLARDLVVYGNLIREQFLNDLRQNSLVNTFAGYYR